MPTRAPTHRPHVGDQAQSGAAYDRKRGSAAARGYDRKWLRFRAAYLAAHPLCADCQQIGRIEAATEVHHLERLRDRPDLRLVEANCRGLCKPHHSARTARGE